MTNSKKANNPRTESSGSECHNPWRSNRIMRKPSQTETPIQSRDMEENQTGNPPRKRAERPTPTEKRKRYNIIPHLIALCVIMATEHSAYALNFNLNTGNGTGTGTLTVLGIGTDPNDGDPEYDLYAVSGTFDGLNITGIDTGFESPDNQIEIDSNGNILVDYDGFL